MYTTFNHPTQSSYPPHTQASVEQTQSLVSKIITVLGIILVIGSLVANGCLYALLGSYSFAIGGGGLALGIFLLICGKWGCASTKTVDQNVEREASSVTTAKQNTNPTLTVSSGHSTVSTQAGTSQTNPPKPSTLDKFRNDPQYRAEQLRNKSWYSNDSAANKELVNCIPQTEFGLLNYKDLDQRVQQDIYYAIKNYPSKLAELFTELSDTTMKVLDEFHIAILFGNGFNPAKLPTHYNKLSPEMQKKYVKAVVENYDAIPNKVSDQTGYTWFICAHVLGPLEGLDDKALHQEFERIFEIFMSSTFKAQLFFKHLHKYQHLTKTIIQEKFPLFVIHKRSLTQDIRLTNVFIPCLFSDENMLLAQRLRPHLDDASRRVLIVILTANERCSSTRFRAQISYLS